MTNLGLRQKAVLESAMRKPRRFEKLTDEKGRELLPSEYFGENIFDLPKLKNALLSDAYKKLQATVESGAKIDPKVADQIAMAVKDWALEKGATHFCHWFQPQTGSTAEKHDAFFSFDGGVPVEKLSGSQLIQSEPDASSFPSGGMRTTFEARGYTAWDPTSPFFIIESTNGKTLCIPSAFISYHGNVLDEKTSLLRSNDALTRAVGDLIEELGQARPKRVAANLGTEQEFFLIDRAFYANRPDLVMSGRTLIGAQPARGQQLEDHYFGSIPSRALACMSEVESELYKLGMPVKTRHNEVAPSQFEMAPIFEEANVAADHNSLMMDVIGKVAARHNYKVLLHEKPFDGLNGSGKHCNWSISVFNKADGSGQNLLNPGKTPQDNMRFLLALASVLKGVHKHSGLLRAGIASHGNDHRLGANEAPPAIISVFLGEVLNEILDSIEKGEDTASDSTRERISMGVARLPSIAKDNTDRNRTSPFAFTGNKFEFRAVGGSANVCFPMTLLNAAVADGMDVVTETLRSNKSKSDSLETAIELTLKQIVSETKAVRFEGNNYSDEWVAEAEKRGLPHLRNTPEAMTELMSKQSIEMLTRLKVFSESEIESRYNIKTERYINHRLIEAETLTSLVKTVVRPAALKQHSEWAKGAIQAKEAGVQAPQTAALGDLTTSVQALDTHLVELEKLLKTLGETHDEPTKAKMIGEKLVPAMEELRWVSDTVEESIDDEYWPLAKYREMLFMTL
jgi:glutamine synthetase